MATCPNCKYPQPDGAIFCEHCGTMLSTDSAVNVPLEPPLITKLRKVGASGVMLALAVFYTISLGVQLVSGFIQLMSGSISLPIFPIIICIALWAIYLTAKKPTGTLVSTGGVTALFVLQIIDAVLMGLCALLFILCTAIFGVMGNSPSLEAELGSDFVTLVQFFTLFFAAFVVLCVVELVICIWGVRFYSSVRSTLQTGFSYCKSAAPFAVFMLLGGIFSVVLGVAYILFSSSLGALMQDLAYGLESMIASMDSDIRLTQDIYSTLPGVGTWILSGVQSLIAGIAGILGGVMIFKYRKAVKE